MNSQHLWSNKLKLKNKAMSAMHKNYGKIKTTPERGHIKLFL